jgi:hypothetical protein
MTVRKSTSSELAAIGFDFLNKHPLGCFDPVA